MKRDLDITINLRDIDTRDAANVIREVNKMYLDDTLHFSYTTSSIDLGALCPYFVVLKTSTQEFLRIVDMSTLITLCNNDVEMVNDIIRLCREKPVRSTIDETWIWVKNNNIFMTERAILDREANEKATVKDMKQRIRELKETHRGNPLIESIDLLEERIESIESKQEVLREYYANNKQEETS